MQTPGQTADSSKKKTVGNVVAALNLVYNILYISYNYHVNKYLMNQYLENIQKIFYDMNEAKK